MITSPQHGSLHRIDLLLPPTATARRCSYARRYLEDASANGFAGQLPANSVGLDVHTGIIDAPAGLVTATAAEGDDAAAVDLVFIGGIAGAVTILALVVIVVILIIVIIAMLVAKKSSTASVSGNPLASQSLVEMADVHDDGTDGASLQNPVWGADGV